MKPLFTVLLLLFAAGLAAIPDYVEFYLDIYNISTDTPPWTTLLGIVTVRNNGTVNWVHQNQYGLGHIFIDGQHGTVGWMEWPFNLVVPPGGTYSESTLGENTYLGPGVHTARFNLCHDRFNYEPVGNTVSFSNDQVLSGFADLNWQLLLNETSAYHIDATFNAMNESNYLWKRDFPYSTTYVLSVDGNLPQQTYEPDSHAEIVGPHYFKTYDILQYADTAFGPGDHTVQACALTPEPVLVGPIQTFHIQGTATPAEPTPTVLPLAAFPNPFQASTTIRYTQPKSGPADLAIYNLKGQLVRRFGPADKGAGAHSLTWSGDDDRGISVAPGLYLIRLSAGGLSGTAKVLRW